MIFKPSMYYNSIYDINYDKLKEMGIKNLIFDLDNTLGLISDGKCPEKTRKLIKKLKKDFFIVICSNNSKARLKPYMDELEIDGMPWSLKPLMHGLFKIKRKHKLKKKETVLIGDQIVTDVFAGKKFGIKTILVDPLGIKDLKITFFNRKLEDIIIKIYTKRGKFERGRYYE